MASNTWTRDELILALNLYLQLPFGRLHSKTPEIIHLANLLHRTSGAVAMRLNNFASVDPFHQKRGIKGLEGGKKQVQPIWDEFIQNRDDLLFESEKILSEKEHFPIEKKYSTELLDIKNLRGEDKLKEVKTRVNQSIFRRIVLANYEGKCAISRIDMTDFLVASHIIPWASNEQERLNPENGICLSTLYDRAFDKGYITVNEKYEIQVATDLKKKKNTDFYARFFQDIEGKKLSLPDKYYPRKEFIQFHQDMIFRK